MQQTSFFNTLAQCLTSAFLLRFSASASVYSMSSTSSFPESSSEHSSSGRELLNSVGGERTLAIMSTFNRNGNGFQEFRS